MQAYGFIIEFVINKVKNLYLINDGGGWGGDGKFTGRPSPPSKKIASKFSFDSKTAGVHIIN